MASIPQFKALFFFAISCSLSALSFAKEDSGSAKEWYQGNCKSAIQKNITYQIFFCDENGTVIRTENYFLETNGLQKIQEFSNNRLTRKQSWSLDGKQSVDLRYEYLNDQKFYRSKVDLKDSKKRIDAKSLIEIIDAKEVVLENWLYNSNTLELELIKIYIPHTQLEQRRVYIKKDKIEKQYQFEYKANDIQRLIENPWTSRPQPIAFKVFDAQDKQIGDYQNRSELSQSFIQQHKIAHNNENKKAVLFIDGGFDLTHPRVASSIWKNPKELLDGIDNDGNGLVDDLFGWSQDNQNSAVFERLFLEPKEIPSSHGSHVMDIGIRGRSQFAAALFSGDYSDYEHLDRASQFIKDHQIEFANLSFGFDKEDGSFDPDTNTIYSMIQLFETNPSTLFMIAAGNDSSNLNGPNDNFQHPASYSNENMLVVGAINSDRIQTALLPSYKLSDYTTVGIKSVDILAPGDNISAALLGGGEIAMSGTSMASPYLLNHGALALKENFPSLSTQEIKEILLKSAYVPLEKPFPVRSGGILYPERALLVAKEYLQFRANGVEAASLVVRKQELIPLLGEANDPASLMQLQDLWRDRDL